MRRPRLGAIAGGTSRRRVGAGLALLAVVAVVVAVVLANRSSSPSNAAGASPTGGAATVARRDLVQTDTESGTLSYSDPQTVYNRLGGTLTWLPQVGREVRPGGTLYKVDGRPVILMSGSTPAYRTLSPAVGDGADVLQLNRNLVRLGFNPDGIVVDDVWQPATTVGVELFQESLGEAPTGTLSLGEIVFLPGAQLISTVDATRGGNGGGGSGNSATQASTNVGAPRAEFVTLTTSTTPPPTDTTPPPTDTPTSPTPTTRAPVTSPTTSTSPTPTTSPTTTTTTTTTVAAPPKRHKSAPVKRHTSGGKQLGALIALLKVEIAQLKRQHAQSPPSDQADNASKAGSSSDAKRDKGSNSSHSSDSASADSKASGGGGGGAASAIMQTTSTRLVVTVDLDASLQSEASAGEHVMVELPDGKWVPGKVTAVSSVAQTSSGSGDDGGGAGGGSSPGGGSGGSSSTIPVTITLSGHQSGAGLDQAAVSVNFSKARANNVLSVPVTALLATSGSTYAVQEAAPPHKLIPVKTGLFAAGDVQISGAGIHPGLQVTDAEG